MYNCYILLIQFSECLNRNVMVPASGFLFLLARCVWTICFEYKFIHTSTDSISNFAHIYDFNIYASPHLLSLNKFKYKYNIHTHLPKFDSSSSSLRDGQVQLMSMQVVGKWAWSDVLGGFKLLALAQAKFEHHSIYIGRKY